MQHIAKCIFPETIVTRFRLISAGILMENMFLGIRILITKKPHTTCFFRYIAEQFCSRIKRSLFMKIEYWNKERNTQLMCVYGSTFSW